MNRKIIQLSFIKNDGEQKADSESDTYHFKTKKKTTNFRKKRKYFTFAASWGSELARPGADVVYYGILEPWYSECENKRILRFFYKQSY